MTLKTSAVAAVAVLAFAGTAAAQSRPAQQPARPAQAPAAAPAQPQQPAEFNQLNTAATPGLCVYDLEEVMERSQTLGAVQERLGQLAQAEEAATIAARPALASEKQGWEGEITNARAANQQINPDALAARYPNYAQLFRTLTQRVMLTRQQFIEQELFPVALIAVKNTANNRRCTLAMQKSQTTFFGSGADISVAAATELDRAALEETRKGLANLNALPQLAPQPQAAQPQAAPQAQQQPQAPAQPGRRR